MLMEDDDCEDKDEEGDDEEYDELEFDETSDYDEYELENEDAFSVIDDDDDESLSRVSDAFSNDLDDDKMEPPPYSPVEKADLELMETRMDNSLDLSQCSLMYKLVGDDVDKNVNPRYRRTDHKNKSLHYYHS
uniref:Uncharacterized protein n=1 Tax=Amphimedon queenslandica TaxID=400682 RepID=A0A1X7TES1_AMPQE